MTIGQANKAQTKAQAAALAENFLDDIGTDKDELVPRETLTQLFLLAGELIEDAQNNLNASNSNATGELSKSLGINATQSGNVVTADITMNFYGKFVNKGVRGTKSGKGLYQFKSPFPSTAMVNALKAGVNRARKSSRNVHSNTSSRNERKNVKISDIDKAYGAGRNIKMYGIEPTGFLDKAIASTENKVAQRLGAALKVDIINAIMDNTTGN